MADTWPPMEDFAYGGQRTPLLNYRLPEWANPAEREENYHHSLRKLFESSEWEILEGYGPETDIGGELVDVLIDVSPAENVIAGVDEYVGIEVKGTPDAFETNRKHLEQLCRQARLGSLDRLYACTPDVPDYETRLDIDPDRSRLINLIDIAKPSMLFRGIKGTYRRRDGTEISMVAYYNRLFHQDKERLLGELKQNGHLEQVKQNVSESGKLSMPDDDDDASWDRGDEFIDPILDQVGIVRLDPDTGDIRVQKEAKHLDRSSTPRCVEMEKIEESDIVYTVWCHFINQSDVEVCTEVELPSQTEAHEEDKVHGTSNEFFKDYFGKQVSRRAPRIDLVVAQGAELRGIEVKGRNPDWDRLVQQQLPKYTRATELDAVDIAVLAEEVEEARECIESKFSEVGLISVLTPRNDSVVERVK